MTDLSLSKLVEIGVKSKQLSQYLFKYRTITSTKKLLENNSLWFSSPKDFNDPFDCQLAPDTNNTEEQIREFLRCNTYDQISEEQINLLASQTFTQPNRWKSIMEDAFDKIINATGICCFTKNEKNLLMWSHYTDSHKGVCLKFNVLNDTDFFAFPLPVNYRNDYPAYNHLVDRQTLINDMILSKSTDWSYEEEIRIVKMNTIGLISFKKEALEEIIFGCNSSPKEIAETIKLSQEKEFKIKFKKAVKKEKEFGFDIKDL